MTTLQALAGRTLLAASLGVRRVRRRPRTAAPRGARLAAAVFALAVPGGTAVATRASFVGPTSPLGRALLAGHVLSGAVLEELIWRAPLTGGTHRSGRAVVSASGFVAMHVRRDGVTTTPIHLVLASAWTASALLGRTIRWNCVGHAAYNYLAITGRPR